MSIHRTLLDQAEPLDLHEVAELRDWLAILRDDVAGFGATPEDIALMARIQAKIDASPPPDCTPSFCGLGHGAKCFNAGRCIRKLRKVQA